MSSQTPWRIAGPGGAPKRGEQVRTMPVARTISLVLVVLLVGCATETWTEGGTPVRQTPPAALTEASAAPGPAAEATGAEPEAVEAAPEAGPEVGPPEDAPDTAEQSEPASESAEPSQAPAVSLDSLAARLNEVVSSQERILARLDSVAPASPAQAESDTAAAGATLDLDEAREEVRGLGVGIFWSLVVVTVFHFLIRFLVWILEALAERSVRRRFTFKSLVPIVRMVLWATAAFLILRTVFGVDAQGLLAASAAVGVALGFAAQDLLKNVFGGLIVVFDQPFQVGDKISVGETYGEVVSIGLRSTRIVTADDSLVSVPNAQIVQEEVANANAGQPNCQVSTELFLPGRVDERKAKRIAFEAAVTSKYVFLERPIVVLVADEFRETFLTRIKVRAYVLDPRFEFLFRSDITERARDGFRAAGLVPEIDAYRMYGMKDGGDGAAGDVGGGAGRGGGTA